MQFSLLLRSATRWLILVVATTWCWLQPAAQTATIRAEVMVTIPPLHSLVQAVLGDVAVAKSLLQGIQSPHDKRLTPSELRQLHNAEVIFLIDPEFETFLHAALEALAEKDSGVTVVPMTANANIAVLARRKLQQSNEVLPAHLVCDSDATAKLVPAAGTTDSHLFSSKTQPQQGGSNLQVSDPVAEPIVDGGQSSTPSWQFAPFTAACANDLAAVTDHDDMHDAGHDADHDVDHDEMHDADHDEMHDADHDAEHDADHDEMHDADHDADHDEMHDADHDADHDEMHDADHDADHDEMHDADHDDVHAHGDIDLHFWLDPQMAVQMIDQIRGALTQVFPQHEQIFTANAAQIQQKLTALDDEIGKKLAASRGIPFVVMHDAYQYFELRYQLAAAAAIRENEEIAPSALHLRRIQQITQQHGIKCIFSEPQFSEREVQLLRRQANLTHVVLDPIGVDIPIGSEQYFTLLRQLAANFTACLKG